MMNSTTTHMCLMYAAIAYIIVTSFIQGTPKIKGVSCQSKYLNLSSLAPISSCSSGLIANIDNYVCLLSLDSSESYLSNLVDFQIRLRNTATYQSLCTPTLTTCGSPSNSLCYCASNVGSMYQVVLNRTADLVESGADIRVTWTNTSGTNVLDSNVLSLPNIYDIRSVIPELTIDGANITCPMNVTSSSVFKFYCLNSPSPCHITVELDNNTVASGDDAISFTVPSAYFTTTYNYHTFTFNFTVCGRPSSGMECQVFLGTSDQLISSTLNWWIIIVIILGIIVYVLLYFLVVWATTNLVNCKAKVRPSSTNSNIDWREGLKNGHTNSTTKK